MDDLNSLPPEEPGQRIGAGAPVSMGRRRFAKGAAPVVLGSLLSKPVLGAEYICTVSGHASGNASVPADADLACDVGNTPEQWRDELNWPEQTIAKGGLPELTGSNTGSNSESPTVTGNDKEKGKGKGKSTLPSTTTAPAPSTEPLSTTAATCTFTPARGTVFNGYAGLATSFYYSTTSCALVTTSEGGEDASMYQILVANGFAGDPELLQLGRAVVASLLNVAKENGNYPVSQARIVAMFNAVKDGGSYFVEGPKLSLTRTGVIRYLEKLYS
jgi:hypothetical protein